jgi:predicted RNase H-like nuclease (RuvC/YqgF family)
MMIRPKRAAMDASVIAAIVSAMGALATVGGTVATAMRSSKDKTDRAADRSVAQKTAEKLEAEREQIAEQTRGMLLQDIREELARSKIELAEAKVDVRHAEEELDKANGMIGAMRRELVEKNRKIDAQDEEIYQLNAQLRRAMRRAAACEEWIETNATILGVEGLPPDALDDRRGGLGGYGSHPPNKDPGENPVESP